MEIRVVVGDIVRQEADALLVNLFEGAREPGGATAAVDRALDGAISSLIRAGEVKGKRGEVTVVHTLGRLPSPRVAVAGLGRREGFSAEAVRWAVAEACRRLRGLGASTIATIAHGAGAGGLSPQESAEAVAQGALLGLYNFNKYRSAVDDPGEVRLLTIVTPQGEQATALEAGVARGRAVAEAVALCRDLVNEPANELTPSRLAEVAQEIARQHGLEVTVLDREQCARMGMGAFLAVARGSHQPPRFIVLTYRGDPDNPDNNLGLLGKGITFDSGGISLKPSQGMEEMKGDMAGGASVLCAVKALAQLGARINATAIVPATENMPGGGASRPGDIVRAMNGKTIEILNTDAEGRLVLADALCYARRQGLRRLVDVATLTGAIRIALGDVRMGLFTNDQAWGEQVLRAGEATGEKMWQLPLDEDYREQIKGQVADIKNIGGRAGGAITAAWFLREFAEDTPWAHLDIAAVARSEKDRGYYIKGATGVPVRSLVHLALSLAGE